MQLYSDDYQDISKYYKHTYVKLPQFGDKIFFVQSIQRERVELIDEEAHLFHIELAEVGEPAFSLEYVLPHRAVFGYKGSVVLLTRIPARQFRRGCCTDNTKIMDLFTGRGLEVNFTTLQAFVNKPNYFSLREALYQEFPKTMVGVAITDRFSFHRNTQALYVDHQHIATFVRERGQFEVHRPIFLPEIRNLYTMCDLEMEMLDASGKTV